MPAIITPDRINQWFTSANYPYGAPANAAEIAPALDAALRAELQTDPTPARFNMDLSATVAHVELFRNYLNGQYPSVPAPMFDDLSIIYDPVDDDLPAIGDTLTGGDAINLLWHVSTEAAARAALSTAPLTIAVFNLTFADEYSEDTYRLTRVK